jgi:hypothetical protein
LVHAARCIADDNLDGLEWHVEFFGDHLRHGDLEPLPEIGLAGKNRNRAVGVHRDIGRQLVGRERRLGADKPRLLGRARHAKRHRRAD